MSRASPPPRPRRIRLDPERVDMATLIPDDRTLATMSALTALADRGEEPTLAAIAAEIRSERTWLARAAHRADPAGISASPR